VAIKSVYVDNYIGCSSLSKQERTDRQRDRWRTDRCTDGWKNTRL